MVVEHFDNDRQKPTKQKQTKKPWSKSPVQLIPPQKKISKWITDLNVKPKMIFKRRWTLQNLGVGKEFLDLILKAKSIKGFIN